MTGPVCLSSNHEHATFGGNAQDAVSTRYCPQRQGGAYAQLVVWHPRAQKGGGVARRAGNPA